MLAMLFRKRGQSLTELAVFGSLTLVALGFLVRTGLKINYAQDFLMQSFRQGLYLAKEEGKKGKSPGRTVFKNKRIYNVEDKHMAGEPELFSGSQDAVWSKKLMLFTYDEKDLPQITYKIDGAEPRTYTTGAAIDVAGVKKRTTTTTFTTPGYIAGYHYGTTKTTTYDSATRLTTTTTTTTTYDSTTDVTTTTITIHESTLLVQPRRKVGGRPEGSETFALVEGTPRHWYWKDVDWNNGEELFRGASVELTGDIYEEIVLDPHKIILDDDIGYGDTAYIIKGCTAIDLTKGEVNLVDTEKHQGLTGSFKKDTSLNARIKNTYAPTGYNTDISTKVDDVIMYEVEYQDKDGTKHQEWIVTSARSGLLPQETDEHWSD